MKLFYRTVALALLLSLIACRSVEEFDQKALIAQENRALGKEFVMSFCDDRQDDFIKCLSLEVRKSFNSAQFEKSYKNITEQYGKIEDYEFLTTLANPLYDIQIWKIKFVKKENVNEMLFRVLITHVDKKSAVVSFAFL